MSTFFKLIFTVVAATGTGFLALLDYANGDYGWSLVMGICCILNCLNFAFLCLLKE